MELLPGLAVPWKMHVSATDEPRRLGSPRWLAALLVPLAWAGVAAAMAFSWSSDPHDPALTGTAAYGHNGEGALSFGLVLTGIEALVLLGAMRPWSYTAKSWLRPLLTLPAAVLWTLLSGILTMHAGGIITLHLLWMLAVDLALVVAAIATLVARACIRSPAASHDEVPRRAGAQS